MSKARSESGNPIDTLMERASRALVRRRYFETEQLCVDALRSAQAADDYERMARVLLPLEEARRQKRDLAYDADHVEIVNDILPEGHSLTAGCYLVTPPRVGADGRALRELADRMGVPTIIVVREPTTRDGRWPIVALGPITLRTKVTPPTGKKGAGKGSVKRAATSKPPYGKVERPAEHVAPSPTWFLNANEQLGDAAIAAVDPTLDPLGRADALFKRLEAHPDHEKLHQALADACRASVAYIAVHGKPKRPLAERARAKALDEGYDSDL